MYTTPFAEALGGQTLTAALLNDWFDRAIPLRVSKTADESVTSVAAVQNDDVLVLPVVANVDYEVWLMAVCATAASATPDLRAGFSFPAGATFSGNIWAPDTAAAAAVATTSYAGFVNNASPFNTPRGLINGSNLVYLYQGVLKMGGTGGNFQFQWSQNTSAAEATTIKAGSELVLRRLK